MPKRLHFLLFHLALCTIIIFNGALVQAAYAAVQQPQPGMQVMLHGQPYRIVPAAAAADAKENFEPSVPQQPPQNIEAADATYFAGLPVGKSWYVAAGSQPNATGSNGMQQPGNAPSPPKMVLQPIFEPQQQSFAQQPLQQFANSPQKRSAYPSSSSAAARPSKKAKWEGASAPSLQEQPPMFASGAAPFVGNPMLEPEYAASTPRSSSGQLPGSQLVESQYVPMPPKAYQPDLTSGSVPFSPDSQQAPRPAAAAQIPVVQSQYGPAAAAPNQMLLVQGQMQPPLAPQLPPAQIQYAPAAVHPDQLVAQRLMQPTPSPARTSELAMQLELLSARVQNENLQSQFSKTNGSVLGGSATTGAMNQASSQEAIVQSRNNQLYNASPFNLQTDSQRPLQSLQPEKRKKLGIVLEKKLDEMEAILSPIPDIPSTEETFNQTLVQLIVSLFDEWKANSNTKKPEELCALIIAAEMVKYRLHKKLFGAHDLQELWLVLKEFLVNRDAECLLRKIGSMKKTGALKFLICPKCVAMTLSVAQKSCTGDDALKEVGKPFATPSSLISSPSSPCNVENVPMTANELLERISQLILRIRENPKMENGDGPAIVSQLLELRNQISSRSPVSDDDMRAFKATYQRICAEALGALDSFGA